MTDESAPRRRSNPFVTFLAVVGAFVLTTVILFLVAIGWGIFQFSKGFQFSTESDFSNVNSSYLAHIKLNGPIAPELTDEVLKKLERAEDNEKAKGIFFEVNSPGGTVVASQEIFDKIMKIRQSKPILAYYRDVAASGSYYASASSTWIVANRNSMIGSIGVIMTQVGVSRLLDYARLDPTIIKTGPLKDAGSSLRDMTDGDQEYLNELLSQTHQVFMSDVIRGREASARASDRDASLANALTGSSKADASSTQDDSGSTETQPPELRELPLEAMEHMKDGRVVLGKEAVELGLIDALGSKDDALDMFRTALSDPNLELVEWKEPENLDALFERYLDRIQVWADRMTTERHVSQPQILAR